MKRSQLKELVKECVKEVLLEDHFVTLLIRETFSGIKDVITENNKQLLTSTNVQQPVVQYIPTSQPVAQQPQIPSHVQEQINQLRLQNSQQQIQPQPTMFQGAVDEKIIVPHEIQSAIRGHESGMKTSVPLELFGAQRTSKWKSVFQEMKNKPVRENVQRIVVGE